LIKDDELSRLIQESRKMGGKGKKDDLFSYMDENGKYYDIKAEHINNYLEKHMQHRYTAKDFRTWAASWKTAARLAMVSEVNDDQMEELVKLHEEAGIRAEETGFPAYLSWMGRTMKGTDGLAKLANAKKLPGETEKERNATMLAIIDTVAADLGNTRAVCRSSYIRPMFMDDWEDGIFLERWKKAKGGKNRGNELSEDENTAINYMRNHEDEEFDE
jgi:DNA topoisomerase-1